MRFSIVTTSAKGMTSWASSAALGLYVAQVQESDHTQDTRKSFSRTDVTQPKMLALKQR